MKEELTAEQRAMMHGMNCPRSSMGSANECTCGLRWKDALVTAIAAAESRGEARGREAERAEILADLEKRWDADLTNYALAVRFEKFRHWLMARKGATA